MPCHRGGKPWNWNSATCGCSARSRTPAASGARRPCWGTRSRRCPRSSGASSGSSASRCSSAEPSGVEPTAYGVEVAGAGARRAGAGRGDRTPGERGVRRAAGTLSVRRDELPDAARPGRPGLRGVPGPGRVGEQRLLLRRHRRAAARTTPSTRPSRPTTRAWNCALGRLAHRGIVTEPSFVALPARHPLRAAGGGGARRPGIRGLVPDAERRCRMARASSTPACETAGFEPADGPRVPRRPDAAPDDDRRRSRHLDGAGDAPAAARRGRQTPDRHAAVVPLSVGVAASRAERRRRGGAVRLGERGVPDVDRALGALPAMGRPLLPDECVTLHC